MRMHYCFKVGTITRLELRSGTTKRLDYQSNSFCKLVVHTRMYYCFKAGTITRLKLICTAKLVMRPLLSGT